MVGSWLIFIQHFPQLVSFHCVLGVGVEASTKNILYFIKSQTHFRSLHPHAGGERREHKTWLSNWRSTAIVIQEVSHHSHYDHPTRCPALHLLIPNPPSVQKSVHDCLANAVGQAKSRSKKCFFLLVNTITSMLLILKNAVSELHIYVSHLIWHKLCAFVMKSASLLTTAL